MNDAQKEKLNAFAQCANWQTLHPLDDERWDEFMAEARNAPDEIQDGEVWDMLVGKACPYGCAGMFEWECRNGKMAWGRRLLRKVGETRKSPMLKMAICLGMVMLVGAILVAYLLKNGKDSLGSVQLWENGMDSLGGVQLWENGPYWAECNVGATKPDEFGYYFWWGDTVGYKRRGGTKDGNVYTGVTWVSSAGEGMNKRLFESETSICPTFNRSISDLRLAGYVDLTGNLVAKHDAATAHLGAPWRMPTAKELDDLIDNCTTTWTRCNGVYGLLVTGKDAYASKSIFLPAAGYGCGSYLFGPGSHGFYWSSTPYSGNSDYAWGLVFDSGDFSPFGDNRYYGRSVRPLRGFAK